jgi:hypothetical protein
MPRSDSRRDSRRTKQSRSPSSSHSRNRDSRRTSKRDRRSRSRCHSRSLDRNQRQRRSRSSSSKRHNKREHRDRSVSPVRARSLGQGDITVQLVHDEDVSPPLNVSCTNRTTVAELKRHVIPLCASRPGFLGEVDIILKTEEKPKLFNAMTVGDLGLRSGSQIAWSCRDRSEVSPNMVYFSIEVFSFSGCQRSSRRIEILQRSKPSQGL